jgi:hypothetical protein
MSAFGTKRTSASPYSITSSARPTSGNGMAIPSALAVLRFRISSTFVARCTAFEDAAGVDASQTVCVDDASSVAYEAAGRSELAELVDRRHRVIDRQLGELLTAAREKWIGADHERACPQLGYRCKDCIEIAVAARMQDMELQPEAAGRCLRLSRYSFGSGSGRVDE